MEKEELDTLFGKWQLQLRKGLLSYLVLDALKDREMYGYALISSLSKKLSGDMAEGTIYPLLNRMLRDKLITFRWEIMESGPARKYYSITEQGRAFLEKMKGHFSDLKARNVF